ncbi:MAG: hypothetical protein R3C44_20990 [Chloroflexota bacterium]
MDQPPRLGTKVSPSAAVTRWTGTHWPRHDADGGRLPLLSPVPNDIPGHIDALPTRDLDQARSLLLQEGYFQHNTARYRSVVCQ